MRDYNYFNDENTEYESLDELRMDVLNYTTENMEKGIERFTEIVKCYSECNKLIMELDCFVIDNGSVLDEETGKRVFMVPTGLFCKIRNTIDNGMKLIL